MKVLIATLASLACSLGCAGSPAPATQRMADVQAAERTAIELGAHNNPRAQLHLKLAGEHLARAKEAVEDDDELRADGLLARAKADAELAIALTREDDAKTKAHKAVDRANVRSNKTLEQGAPQ